MTFPTGTPSRWFHARPAPRRRPCRRHAAWLLAAAACGGTTDIITPPPPPPATFVLQFAADPDDASTAQAMGWQNGIPDVDFVLRPADTTTGGSQTFRGSPQGSATLSGVAPGRYLVTATRWLTSPERTRLPGTDDATGFLAKTEVEVTASGSRTVPMYANRRRGLVISEWAFNVQFTNNNASTYDFGGFLEVFNNADSTIYLDGLLVGEGFNRDYDYPLSGCAENAPYTNDPGGIWTRFFQRLPGGGRDYPLAPGRTAVIATDAIDHRPIAPEGLDLRQAQFESSGPLDADNPSVPNLLDIGLSIHILGHGLSFPGTSAVVVLAAAGDTAGFARARFSDANYLRIPRARILDVLWIESPWEFNFPPCPRLVSPVFDRLGTRDRGTDSPTAQRFSLSRVRSLAPGQSRVILQHTRSGSLDFIRTLRTPGAVQ